MDDSEELGSRILEAARTSEKLAGGVAHLAKINERQAQLIFEMNKALTLLEDRVSRLESKVHELIMTGDVQDEI